MPVFQIKELSAAYSDGQWLIKDAWGIGTYSPRKKSIDSPSFLHGALKSMGCPIGGLKCVRSGEGVFAISEEDGCPKYAAVLKGGNGYDKS